MVAGAGPAPLGPSSQGPGSGRIGENVMHFGRLLRAAGLPVGTGAVLAAIEALQATGFGSREDLYWTLHSTLVRRREEREVFDQAFHIFWRNPRLLDKLMGLALPQFATEQDEPLKPGAQRVAEALATKSGGGEAPERREIDARFSFSETELLQEKDFEQMTTEELAAARRALADARLAIPERRTRRFRTSEQVGQIDMRRTLRATLRQGGDLIALRRRMPRSEPRPLVVLCDISGSMGEYTRLFLHFVHTLMSVRRQVHVFVFGTRLTNITRQLRDRDVDAALGKVSDAVEDWSGGTRIGHCLAGFNRDWSRRVLGGGAVVLLVSDGLERVSDGVLDAEADRLHRSCARLIWLNPLLRYDRFEPRASGIKTLIGHVDEFRPVHNLNAIASLVEALSSPVAQWSRVRSLQGVA